MGRSSQFSDLDDKAGLKNVNSYVFSFSHPERIHQAQAAAAKARKALQQKPKPASKPVSQMPPFYCRKKHVAAIAVLLFRKRC